MQKKIEEVSKCQLVEIPIYGTAKRVKKVNNTNMNNKTRQTLNRSKSQVRSGNYGGFRSNLQYVREVTEEEDDCSSLNNTGEN